MSEMDCDPRAYQLERQRMVKEQLIRRDIRNPRVLEAISQVPRHCFVPTDYRDMAYQDGPLPIGDGQTISQPYIVAYMTQMLDLQGDERVLEIGTGSGYQAAILSRLTAQVFSLERMPALAENARCVLAGLGYDNVQIIVTDGTQGLPEHAPYQAILVTAAAPAVPQPLLGQLADQGRLVLPVGAQYSQNLEIWTRQGQEYQRDILAPVAFVPLIGKDGWQDGGWRD